MGHEKLTHEWEEVVVDPSRLRSGLWGYEEGDISKSYSADLYGNSGGIRKPFSHAPKNYVAMSLAGRPNMLTAIAYPIERESCQESISEQFAKVNQAHDIYVTKPVRYKNSNCLLGLPVIFRMRDLTDDERVDLLRRMYAYGGYFAAE